MKIKHVPIDYIYVVWPQVEPMLAKAMEHSKGEYNLEQLKVMLTTGMQELIVAVDDEDNIKGAATICFENYPNDRIAFMTSVGGRLLTNKSCWESFEGWCKSRGCTKVRGFAFESVARLWKQKFDVDTVYLVVEKKLTEEKKCLQS